MATWHEEMAAAVNLRKKAINGVRRWQDKKRQAEEQIEALSAQRVTEDAPLPAAAVNNDGALFDTELQPLFGVTTGTVQA